MILDQDKVQLAMARLCLTRNELVRLSETPSQSVVRAINGHNVRPATAGKIAKALNVDVLEILKENEVKSK